MTTCLRHAQMEVKAHFAPSALPICCAARKMRSMKVMLAKIRGTRLLEEIADELDVAISTVQRWEKGTMSIPSQRLPDIARAYGCSVKDIFEDDAPGEPISIWSRIPMERRGHALDVLKTFASGGGD